MNQDFLKTTETLKDMWYEALYQYAKITDSNLHNVPKDEYKWNFYGFPLKDYNKETHTKAEF